MRTRLPATAAAILAAMEALSAANDLIKRRLHKEPGLNDDKFIEFAVCVGLH